MLTLHHINSWRLLIMAYWVEFDGSCCRLMLVPNPQTTHVHLVEATNKPVKVDIKLNEKEGSVRWLVTAVIKGYTKAINKTQTPSGQAIIRALQVQGKTKRAGEPARRLRAHAN